MCVNILLSLRVRVSEPFRPRATKSYVYSTLAVRTIDFGGFTKKIELQYFLDQTLVLEPNLHKILSWWQIRCKKCTS